MSSAALGVDGPIALVTAGWEEGERNDADLDRRSVAARATSACSAAASTSSRVDPEYADEVRRVRGLLT